MKDKVVLAQEGNDSYSDLLDSLGIEYDYYHMRESEIFVMARLIPLNNEWWVDPSDSPEKWNFSVDLDIAPDWFDVTEAERIFREAVCAWWTGHVLFKKKIDRLTGGYYRLKRTEVKELCNDVRVFMDDSCVGSMSGHSRVEKMSGYSHVGVMSDDSRVDEMRDSSHVDAMCKNSHVKEMHGGSHVGKMCHDSHVKEMHDGSHVSEMNDSSQVGAMKGHSHVGELYHRAQVHYMCHDSHIGQLLGHSHVEEMCHDSHVDEMRISSHVDEMVDNSYVGKMTDRSYVGEMYGKLRVGEMCDESMTRVFEGYASVRIVVPKNFNIKMVEFSSEN